MGNFKYEKNYSEGGKEVTGYYIFGATAEGKRAAQLTVPSNHEGLPVVGIDSFALSYRGEVRVPDGLGGNNVDLAERIQHVQKIGFRQAAGQSGYPWRRCLRILQQPEGNIYPESSESYTQKHLLQL